MSHIHYALVILILGLGVQSKNVRAERFMEIPPANGFIDFQVYLDGEVASLYWSMKPNSNLISIRIEKSKNRKRFIPISIIDISENSIALTEYQEIDTKPWRRTTYYRLMAIGLDDSCYYSTISKVKYDKRKRTFQGAQSILRNTNGGMLVVVRDVNGIEYFSKVTVTGKDGRIITVIDEHEKLAPGTYQVTGSSDERLNACRIRVEP